MTLDFDLQTVASLLALVGLCAAYVCRLDALSWRTSRPGTVAFHLAGLAYLGGCLMAVLSGHDLTFEWFGLAFCALWLVESWPTWKHGPPAHVMTGPAPFSDTALDPRAVVAIDSARVARDMDRRASR